MAFEQQENAAARRIAQNGQIVEDGGFHPYIRINCYTKTRPGQGGTATWRIGTTSATEYNLEDCSGCGLSAWGWQDNGWGVGVMGPLVYFATTGPHTIRIQTREDGLAIDQIVLSPEALTDNGARGPQERQYESC